MSRYNTRSQAINDKEMYDKLFEKRGIKRINQYRSPTASNTPDEDLAAIECHQVVWRIGTTFEKLAEEYYGDFKQWWVIAGFNRKPTEQHCSLGDIIKIPKDISDGLRAVE
tara:strand:+ start:1180 stop:1512 length:333 start_codon:yes stop_codon:yes gene_type:complete